MILAKLWEWFRQQFIDSAPKVKRMSYSWRTDFTVGRKSHVIADSHMHAREADCGNSLYR